VSPPVAASPPERPGIEWLLGGLLALAILVGGLVWLAASLSAALFGAGWPAARMLDVAAALLALPDHLGDPARAWPPPHRAAMAGPIPFYAFLALLLVALVLVARTVGGIVRERTGLFRGRGAPAARWASRAQLRALSVRAPQRGRVGLGRVGGRLIASEPRQSVMIAAPPQSGKTTGVAIPALLEWDGPAIATSIKTDLLRDTFARRRRLGRVMVFDPTAATGYPASQWSPLGSCGSWYGAQRMADWLCLAARPDGGGLADADFWYAAAAKLLAPMLYAASSSGRTMAELIRWVDTQEETAVIAALEAIGEAEPLAAAEASWRREERQRSSIYTTAETVLAAYADPRVMAASQLPEISAAELLDGGSHTLYLCAPAHEQRRLAPLFATVIEEIVSVVYESASASGGPLDPPLLFVGDELANIAPLRRLPELASTGAGQGIQLVSIFQDLAQVRERWGVSWRTVANNHRAKLFGTGIGDPETLDYVRQVSGESEYRQRSDTTGYIGQHSWTDATTYRALAPAHVVREAQPGTAVLIYGHLPPARLRLRLWFRDRRLKELAAEPDAGIQSESSPGPEQVLRP
jgi:type IV secretion system protein VirD4